MIHSVEFGKKKASDNVIRGLFSVQVRVWIWELYACRQCMIYMDPPDIARELGIRRSIVNQVIKRGLF